MSCSMTPVRLEPAAPRSPVKHSTIEPLRSPKDLNEILYAYVIFPALFISVIVFFTIKHEKQVIEGALLQILILFFKLLIRTLLKKASMCNMQTQS